METFKVGDRVRVKQECVGCNCRGDGVDGGYGIITETRGKRWFGVKLDNEEVKYEPSYREDELILLEDTMEYTKNGVTYRQLKDITIKALILAGADDNYVEHFDLSHDITEPILIKYAIDYALHSSYDFQKLVDQGFVEVVEERKIDIDQILRIGGIQKRGSGNLANKSAYLSRTFSWSIEIDDKGVQCLVPKHKR